MLPTLFSWDHFNPSNNDGRIAKLVRAAATDGGAAPPRVGDYAERKTDIEEQDHCTDCVRALPEQGAQ